MGEIGTCSETDRPAVEENERVGDIHVLRQITLQLRRMREWKIYLFGDR